MDERGQELNELRDYGAKLLEEMKYPDLIGMLQETMTHLHDIATEYATDAKHWHDKYDACEAQNVAMQQEMKNLTAALDRQKDEMAAVVNAQSDNIRRMGQEFERKLDELRSYRDAEVAEYNKRVQTMLATQEVLQQKKEMLAVQEQRLAEARQLCENERKDLEKTREEYENQIKFNQMKIEAYPELSDDKRNYKKQLDDAKKVADDQLNSMRRERDAWKDKHDKEQHLRVLIENKLGKLQKDRQEKAASPVGEQRPSEDAAQRQKITPFHKDEDEYEDGTR